MATLGGLLNFVRSSQFFDQEAVNRLYQEAAEMTEPIKGDIVERRIVLKQDVRERTNTLQPIGPDFSPVEERGVGIITMNRKRPATVKSNPLIYSIHGGALNYVSGSNTKVGGGMEFSGANGIIIDDHPLLSPTDEISFVGWFYIGVRTGTHRIIYKPATYAIDIISANTIRAGINNGAWQLPTVSYTPNTWFHLAMTYKNTGSSVKIYINGVQESEDITSGDINTFAGDVGLGFSAAGLNQFIMDGSRFAHVSLLHKEVSSSWINNHMNGLLDTSDGNDEIFTFPFTGTTKMLTDMTSGEFRST